MKRIDKWVTRDGAEFRTVEEAQSREHLLDKIDAIESELPLPDTSTDFANGYGYIQHQGSKLLRARASLIKLAQEYAFSEIAQYPIKSNAFSRYLDDSATPLYKLYCRIVLCVDDNTWREYGQAYYAHNPEKAKSVRVR